MESWSLWNILFTLTTDSEFIRFWVRDATLVTVNYCLIGDTADTVRNDTATSTRRFWRRQAAWDFGSLYATTYTRTLSPHNANRKGHLKGSHVAWQWQTAQTYLLSFTLQTEFLGMRKFCTDIVSGPTCCNISKNWRREIVISCWDSHINRHEIQIKGKFLN
jgi:hypothetical protein